MEKITYNTDIGDVQLFDNFWGKDSTNKIYYFVLEEYDSSYVNSFRIVWLNTDDYFKMFHYITRDFKATVMNSNNTSETIQLCKLIPMKKKLELI